MSTQADFLKGDVADLSIDSDGRMFLGPSASLVAETAAPFLWTVVAGADGTLWAGSGNEGKVLKVGKDGKLSTFFDAPELEVHALAAAPNGGLYVGTSPDGKIYQVAADGTSKTFFDPEDKYIWALAVDKSGNVFAATGDKGVIYKITPDGKGARFYKTNASNVVSLAFTKTGELIAGTESPGRVFRIDAAGKAFVLLDSPFREIHAVRLAADGTIYAVAVSGSAGRREPRDRSAAAEPARPPVPSVSTEITAITVMDSPVGVLAPAAQPARSARRGGRGAIYRIRPDGLWDIAVGLGRRRAVRPGDRAVRQPARRHRHRRQDFPGQRRPGARDAAGPRHGAAGDGAPARAIGPDRRRHQQSRKAVRALADRRRGAAPTSPTCATPAPSRAGAPSAGAPRRAPGRSRLHAHGNTARRTRPGARGRRPTRTPAANRSSARTRGTCSGAPCCTTTGAQGPVLTSVTAAYLPRNLRPEVSSITVHPPGTVFQRPFSTGEMEIAGFEDNTSDGRPPTPGRIAARGRQSGAAPALGRRIYQKGLQTFVWKAEDENDDRLQFDVLVPPRRGDGLEGAAARR